ncbi:MAG: SAM-dependent methyltransferase, partial [Candidatus Levyibacteriota bacterium]
TGAQVTAFDIDYGALEKNYRDIKASAVRNVLPLFFDMMNPTPALGWEGKERLSLFERGPADTVLALALIHHLAIPHNVPFRFLASAFSRLGTYLIVEFIDKKDSQVQILLANRPDIFPNYTKKDFEQEFEAFYTILRSVSIQGSLRTLYLMERK